MGEESAGGSNWCQWKKGRRKKEGGGGLSLSCVALFFVFPETSYLFPLHRQLSDGIERRRRSRKKGIPAVKWHTLNNSRTEMTYLWTVLLRIVRPYGIQCMGAGFLPAAMDSRLFKELGHRKNTDHYTRTTWVAYVCIALLLPLPPNY